MHLTLINKIHIAFVRCFLRAPMVLCSWPCNIKCYATAEHTFLFSFFFILLLLFSVVLLVISSFLLRFFSFAYIFFSYSFLCSICSSIHACVICRWFSKKILWWEKKKNSFKYKMRKSDRYKGERKNKHNKS